MSGIMNAKSGAIRPPLSLHRIEGRSEPIEPRSPVEALRILQTSPSLDLYALLAESIATPATAGQRQARQEELRASAPYSPPPVTEDRSAWVFGVACELVRRGEDFESYFSIVMAVADENPHLRDRVISRGGRPYLEREWKNACSKADSGDDRAALTRRDTAEERAVADARSSLARAQTELDRGAYRTFEAIVRLLCDTGATTVFGLSVRSAGELSGQSRTTANGALKELMRRSMIMEADVERAFASDSRRFELQPPSAWEVHPANRSPGGAWLSRVIDDPQLHPKYDIWDDAEMGEIGRLIFGFLRHHGGDESPSTQVVAAEVGITPKTASKYLNRLHEAHMIHRSGPGWVAEQVDVELKARDLGIPRHGDVRARMHNHERGDDNLRRSLDRLAKKTIPGQTLTRHGHLSDEQPSVAA